MSETQTVFGEIEAIVARFPANRGSLIPILQEVQAAFGYLSPEALDELELHTGVSANEIYGVATFYTQFRFSPPAQHKIQVCQGTACHVRASQEVMKELQRVLNANPGESTADGKFELHRVACLGCCALGPVVSIDGRIYGGVTPKKVAAMLKEYNE
jgi:NADH-quinone oxidoreductase subunit E